jgi:hydrogenase maturation protease
MQALTLIIGYGNPLRGDDGAGVLAVKRLAGEISSGANREAITCLTVFQLTPELAEDVSQADNVIFIDAARGDTPGQIAYHEFYPAQWMGEPEPGSYTHHVNPATLLANAERLYGKCPAAWLYSITGRNFELGDSLSAEVDQALATLIGQIKARIAQCTNLA